MKLQRTRYTLDLVLPPLALTKLQLVSTTPTGLRGSGDSRPTLSRFVQVMCEIYAPDPCISLSGYQSCHSNVLAAMSNIVALLAAVCRPQSLLSASDFEVIVAHWSLSELVTLQLLGEHCHLWLRNQRL